MSCTTSRANRLRRLSGNSEANLATKQEAHLRVVLQDGNRYALVASASLQGHDLYCVTPFAKGVTLTQSLHASGHGHTRVMNKQRLNFPLGNRLDEFSGFRPLWGCSLSAPELRDWSYVPKPDRKHRRTTLTVPSDQLPRLSSLELWLAERRCHSTMEITWQRRYDRVVATAVAHWTEPELAAVIYATGLPADF